MPLLFSNNAPLRTEFKNYPEKFRELLVESDTLNIATGYISTDSVIDLKSILDANGGPRLELCIGMHYFDGLTAGQKIALDELNKTLIDKSLGNIYFVTTFPFHGKIVSFSKSKKVLGSILGSSNLTNIIVGQRQYETDYLFDEGTEPSRLNDFILQLIAGASKPLNGLELRIVQQDNNLLNGQLGVEKIPQNDLNNCLKNLSTTSFSIALKGNDAPKSGLNVFFGEGRRNKQGFVIPRPWYEVELIVSKNITQVDAYPGYSGQNHSFEVITDDGWTFKCKVSGDYNKNLRSEDDLKILGRWIKGRLEIAGVLKPGEAVTDSTLQSYGKTNIELTKINNSEKWYLDFGV